MKELTFEQFTDHVAANFRPDKDTEWLINNMVFGLAGEVGELIDLMKKELFHEVRADDRQVAGEFGDVLYYLVALMILWEARRLREGHGELRGFFEFRRLAQFNIDKLRARYPNGFVTGGGIR